MGQRAGLASWVGTQMDPFQAAQYSKLFYAINWQTRRKAFNRETAFIKYGSHPSLYQPPPAPIPSTLSLFYHTLMPSFFFLLSLAEFYCVMYLTISHNFFVRVAFPFLFAKHKLLSSSLLLIVCDAILMFAFLFRRFFFLSIFITYYNQTCHSFLPLPPTSFLYKYQSYLTTSWAPSFSATIN